MRVIVSLACTACNNRNYTTTKDKKKQMRLEIKKYCKFCRKHTIHKEVK
ncbi:MAG: 50S ribosomal protein L33 [bacterium]